MTRHEYLEETARLEHYDVEEYPFKHVDGLTVGNRIGLKAGMETAKKTCVLAEEIAHAKYTVGNILDQSNENNRKQELFARTKAYDHLIGLAGIVEIFRHGCTNAHEAAELLEVTEEFLLDALERYRQKYGTYVEYGGYVIQFEPCLSVTKLL